MLMECDNAGRWHLTRGARWGMWITLLVVCGGLATLRIWHNQQRNHRETLAQQATNALQAKQIQLGRQTSQRLSQFWRPGISRAELEQALNAGRPFKENPGGGEIWDDPASGWSFCFTFDEQDRWIQAMSGVYSARNVVSPPPLPASDHLTAWICSALSHTTHRRKPKPTFGLVLWMLLTAGCVIFWRHRGPLAEAMLAMAILWLTAWLVTPGYKWLSGGVVNDIKLTWAIALFAISIPTVVMTRRRQVRSREPLCPTCRYNLTGNQSGTCPECGQRIPKSLRRLIERTPCDAAGSP